MLLSSCQEGVQNTSTEKQQHYHTCACDEGVLDCLAARLCSLLLVSCDSLGGVTHGANGVFCGTEALVGGGWMVDALCVNGLKCLEHTSSILCALDAPHFGLAPVGRGERGLLEPGDGKVKLRHGLFPSGGVRAPYMFVVEVEQHILLKPPTQERVQDDLVCQIVQLLITGMLIEHVAHPVFREGFESLEGEQYDAYDGELAPESRQRSKAIAERSRKTWHSDPRPSFEMLTMRGSIAH
jgi:hypothetical protein